MKSWIDEIPLSRPKRNIARDFADGVPAAEVVHYYFPNLVELHNYSAANAVDKKLYNWNTLNTKALRKLGFQLHPQDIDDVVNARRGAVERVLAFMQVRMARFKARMDSKQEGTPRADNAVAGTPSKSSAPAKYDDRRALQHEVDTEILIEKEQTIHELRETIMIMQEKIKKLEQLLRIKDSKIDALTAKIDQYDRATR